ncbi:coiled-coil domain-containing protein 42 like-2-like [Astyanax mexicanus]|uniref:Coiled-coil domain-containing protein 42 like-2-like n=1 Tax=Astyanax mexicanus TaxID=7994 RepID=A0A8T2L1N1_ASTMX|nr:coiled-coil domain-containing protein 42 like-2-like [Astyanax mexicanus]
MFCLKDTTVPMAEEDLGTGSARILDKQREIKYMAAVLRKHKAEAFAALLTKKDKLQEQVSQNRIYWSFLDSVLKSSEKFEDIGKLIGRFETLVRTREQLLKRQSTLESVQATDAKKTLLLGRIHVATRNLYHMTGGVSSGAAGFNVKDTLDELDRIRQYIQKWTDIVQELGSDKGSIKASDHA